MPVSVALAADRIGRGRSGGDEPCAGDWYAEGGPTLAALIQLVDAVEDAGAEDVDVGAVAAEHGTTEAFGRAFRVVHGIGPPTLAVVAAPSAVNGS